MPPWGLAVPSIAQRDCPCVSPPEGRRGAHTPPAWSRRGGSAQALFWLFSQTTARPCAEALCPGAAAPSGITAVPDGSQPGGLPATLVPGAVSPGQSTLAGQGERRGLRGSRLLSPAAAQGFQTLLTFPLPMCRHVGTEWMKPSPRGELQPGPGNHTRTRLQHQSASGSVAAAGISQ